MDAVDLGWPWLQVSGCSAAAAPGPQAPGHHALQGERIPVLQPVLGVKQGRFGWTERVGLCSCLRGRLHGLGHGGVQCPCKRGAQKQLPVCKCC